jgi:hypothetical protein
VGKIFILNFSKLTGQKQLKGSIQRYATGCVSRLNKFHHLIFQHYKACKNTLRALFSQCPLFIAHCPVSNVLVVCLLPTVWCPLSTFHCQLPTVHCLRASSPLFTAHCLLTIIYCSLFTAYCPLYVYWPVSTGQCPLPTVHCPPPAVHCPPATVYFSLPLSTVHCPLPTAHCPLFTVLFLSTALTESVSTEWNLNYFCQAVASLKANGTKDAAENQHAH